MRTMIVGMCDPHDGDPLGTDRPGSAGHRLWKMSKLTEEQYLEGFERVNLCILPQWNDKVAVLAAHRIMRRAFGRKVILLGDDVRKAFKLPKVRFHPVFQDGVTWRQIPHPSGRCRWYNNQLNCVSVNLLLQEMYYDQFGSQGLRS